MVHIILSFFFFGEQELSVQLATTIDSFPGTSANHGTMSNAGVPLIARVYLTLGSWKRALSPALDDDSIQGINSVSFCTCSFILISFLNNLFFSQKF